MSRRRLGELKKGMGGRISAIVEENEETLRRFLEMGLLEGAEIELVHEAPFGGDPIAVRVRGALIALRRKEACCIEVEV